MEQAFRIAAVLFGLLSLGCIASAIHAYVTLDVRAARDDLSGRKRTRDVAQALQRSARREAFGELGIVPEGKWDSTDKEEDGVSTRLSSVLSSATMLDVAMNARKAEPIGEGEIDPTSAAMTCVFDES